MNGVMSKYVRHVSLFWFMLVVRISCYEFSVVNSEHTHPEKRPPFRNITTQNASIFIEKGVRIREIAQVFRSNATQPLSIAF